MSSIRARILKENGLTDAQIKELTQGPEKFVKTNIQGKVTQMNFIPINETDLPESLRRVAGEPAIRISKNGQLGFNTKASEHFADAEKVIVLADQKARMVALLPFKGNPPKQYKDVTSFKIGHGKDDNTNVFMTFTRFAQMLEYDYVASGTQIFSATWDEKTNMLTFSLPKGALTPRPKRPRKPRVAKATENGNAPVEVPEAELVEA